MSRDSKRRRDGRTFGAAFFRRLLWLYPREFRDEFGSEMGHLYRDRARDEGLLRLWLAVLADVVRRRRGNTSACWCRTFATRSVCLRARHS